MDEDEDFGQEVDKQQLEEDQDDQPQEQIQKEDHQQENADGPSVDDDDDGEEKVPVPLTMEMVGQHISLLARTGNGLSHAYTRLEIHGKGVTGIDILENYPHLRYIAGNQIATIELDDKPHLQLLHLRDNKIRSLSGINESYRQLVYLNLRNNKISNIDEIRKLSVLPSLKTLILSENPIDQLPNYRIDVLLRLPKLEKLDKEPITDEEREEVEQAPVEKMGADDE
ncbi:Leucine-rich repeat-containing protein 23 [Dinochytrium kinnereticum]|nr:Leucine-rich repeat-containing protein 23 [Dinochytrium kinnereticum]